MENGKIQGVITPERLNWLTQNLVWGDVTLYAKTESDCHTRGILTNRWSISLAWFLLFLFCDPNVCLSLETKLQNQCLHFFIQRTSVLSYCIPTGIKLQKVAIFLIFTANNFRKRGGVNVHFQTKLAWHSSFHISQATSLIPTRSCAILKTARHSLWHSDMSSIWFIGI